MTFSVVVKEDCATCQLVIPVIEQIKRNLELLIYCQDNSKFPANLSVVDDRTLEYSWRSRIETVPTLIKFDAEGSEVGRAVGWDRTEWQKLAGISLGSDLPAFRPGCGSNTQDPGMPEKLAACFDKDKLASRELEISREEDEIEACFDRGWSDGLPVIPPTPERVIRMLSGTNRHVDEVVGLIPPDLAPCTIEKIAINAVLAGCKPEYLPVVIAAVEAALQDEFCMHGLLATTYYSGPLILVNGPLSRAIGMNSRGNVLGQGLSLIHI